MNCTKVTVGELKENTYVLTEGDECLIIDPGSEDEGIRDAIGNRKILAVICTHNHFDHILGLHAFNAPIFMHRLDKMTLDVMAMRAKQEYSVEVKSPGVIHDLEDEHEFGVFRFSVLHTPGHSPGSVCFYFKEQGWLFTGDTLFANTHGRTDLPGSSAADMRDSLERLSRLPDDTHIYPGHGWDGPLAKEKGWMRQGL